MRKYIQCMPKVFQIPQCKRNSNLIALMMPFDKTFEATHKTVKGVAAKLQMECKRVDDYWHNSKITQDVFELIFKSAFVICDFSGKNPNVFYEAGIAHALGRDIIPIVQNTDDVPFDLREHRFIPYLLSEEGLESLAKKLGKRMQILKNKIQPNKKSTHRKLRVHHEATYSKNQANSSLKVEVGATVAAPAITIAEPSTPPNQGSTSFHTSNHNDGHAPPYYLSDWRPRNW